MDHLRRSRDLLTGERKIVRRIVQCSTGEEHLGQAYDDAGLEQAIVGKVIKITEASSRVLYQGDHKILKDKTTRTYDVGFTAGFSSN